MTILPILLAVALGLPPGHCEGASSRDGTVPARCAGAGAATPVPAPSIPDVDRIRIAEAFRLADQLQNLVWKGWSDAPFALLLVTPEYEFLIRHPAPTRDFIPIGYDPLLRSNVFYRKRTQSVHFQATFPLLDRTSTIVIGQAENTASRTSSSWVITLLHEHFHQLQDSQPGYFAETDALDLSGGDKSGMWNITYPFPYTDARTSQAFDELSRLLADAIETKGTAARTRKSAEYFAALRTFEASLSPKDYRYLSFQLWKEGVARYTEYRVAELAARHYRPTKAFAALPDYKPFRGVASEHFERIIMQLRTMRFDEQQREAFYPFGAGTALLLDSAGPGWQRRYLAEKFFLEKYVRRSSGDGSRRHA
jgi:hypothetical protein